MGMTDLEEALRAVRASDQADFVGPRDPALVSAAERALGVSFPPTFRRFILDLGSGSVGSREFYGVIDDNFATSAVPNGIWLTLDERKKFGLPHSLVIIGDTGMGEYLALDTSMVNDDGEAAIVVWAPGVSIGTGELEIVASDFGTFFLQAVHEEFGPR